MDNEYLKRGYLLPEGCSDLIDVMKLKASAEPAAQGMSWSASPLPIASEITVPEQMTVAELAAALNQKPFRIIGDLIQSGVFATLNQVLDFETIVKVSEKYGFIAKRAVYKALQRTASDCRACNPGFSAPLLLSYRR